MSRAFLPIQPPHHACMNEGGRTGRNGGRMPANERRSREYRPAEQKKYLQATSTALRSRETPASRECRPAGQKKYLQAASAALRSRETPASRECRPTEQKKYQQTAGITPWYKETAGSTDTPLETKETIDDTSAILTNKKEFRQ